MEGLFLRVKKITKLQSIKCPEFIVKPTIAMTYRSFFLFLIFVLALPAEHVGTAQEHLARALRLADLFNWDEAASDFAKAETEFKAVGDHAGELQARIGYIRATADRRVLPIVSAQLQREALKTEVIRQRRMLPLPEPS